MAGILKSFQPALKNVFLKIKRMCIATRRVIYIRSAMPLWKYLEPKKYKRFKKKEAAHVREYRLKKHVRAITTQYWNVNGTNNTNHVISILNKTNFKPNYPHD